MPLFSFPTRRNLIALIVCLLSPAAAWSLAEWLGPSTGPWVGGIFLIAACFVGITALFRWIEINYGLFQAFGVVGALLLVIAAICAAVAASRLKRQPPQFPSLTSRLRVAVKASPLEPDQIDATRDTASAILSAPSSPATRASRRRLSAKQRLMRDNKAVPAGLILIATLLGWAAVRRRHQARRMEA